MAFGSTTTAAATPATSEKKGFSLFKRNPNKEAAPKKEKAPKAPKAEKTPKEPKTPKADQSFKHKLGPDGKPVKGALGQFKKKPRQEFQAEINRLQQENDQLRHDFTALKQWSQSAPR